MSAGSVSSHPGRAWERLLLCDALQSHSSRTRTTWNTSACRLSALPNSTANCARSSELCEILGVSLRGGKPGRFKAIQEQIEYLYREKRQPLILAVDEAQFLNTAILNDIRMLMNYGYDSLNCFTLILCGESHLNSTLRKPVHEALRQRITVHYDFTGLSDTEVPEYVRHKISIAGGAPSIITEAAMASVNSLSQGNPRIIDNIMTDALTIGAQKDRSVIDPEVILSAVNNQNLG